MRGRGGVGAGQRAGRDGCERVESVLAGSAVVAQYG